MASRDTTSAPRPEAGASAPTPSPVETTVRATRPAARHWPQLPFLVSRLLFAGAAILFLHTVFPGVRWLTAVVDLYSTLFIPIDAGSYGLVVLLVIMGGALARGKRAGWVFTLVVLGLLLVADLLTVVLLVSGAVVGPSVEPDLPSFARVAVNLVALSAVYVLLIVYRAEFSARRRPGNVLRALAALALGAGVTFLLGLALVSAVPGDLSGPRGRIGWIISQIVAAAVGDNAPTPTAGRPPPGWITGLIGFSVAVTLAIALLVLLRSQQQAAAMDPADEPRVRALVAESPDDSLAYFNTRRDKSVVFSASGRAAISYRVTLGVCLASADPIGPVDHWPGAIRAWQELIDTYGWTPAVIGASERGATAYDGVGLHVLRLGDEAVLVPRDFHLDDHDLRPVRQAVQRLGRAGYRTRIRRQDDLERAELDALVTKTEAWRDSETERGFSMALGRLGDAADGRCLVVEALFPPDRVAAGPGGEIAGVLSFVPWGSDGFSLDVMRRSPRADNGVTELMVADLMTAGRELGIRQVSLNFAVFRSAFEEGARIGAGPTVRLWRRLLLVASRWWQIESLYRSNVKFRPQWRPRFLCYAEARDIALVGAASGAAEGFIDLPRFLDPTADGRGRTSGRAPTELPAPSSADSSAASSAAPVGPVLGTPIAPTPRVPEQVRVRLRSRERLLAQGIDPYPVTLGSTAPRVACAALERGQVAGTAGRVLAVRDFGGVVFVRLRDGSGDAQLMLEADVLGRPALRTFCRDVTVGDHLGASGDVVESRSGERSLRVESWQLTAKALRPLPDKHRGLTDPESKVRQRYLDLVVDPQARHQLRARSAVIGAVRDTLRARGFLEVETPILQTVHGGANARPFRTHINAYDLDLYLRIAPELYLKRLMVGGMDAVFEIGRNFRNEGVDATHNPEFTMVEAYQAYGDYTSMRELTTTLVREAARAATGGTLVRGAAADGTTHEVDLAEPFRVVTVDRALSEATGEPITPDTSRERLVDLAEGLSIPVDPRWSRGQVVLELYEHLCEHRTVAPTFYCDFPADVSPLTRPHRRDPRLAERWDLVCFGAEIATAYSELVDPVEQRARLTAQSLQAAGGDPEAMALDEDFLVALEHGMPPTGGLGMGLDRLVMMITQSSIRQTIAFPLVRPRR